MSDFNPLTVIQDTLAALNVPASDSFSPGALTVESERIEDPHEVLRRVEAFARDNDLLEGWVQTTHAMKAYRTPRTIEHFVQNAELAAESVSLHVRQGTRGDWLLTTFRRCDPAAGAQAFIERVEFMACEPFEALVYEIAWEKTQDASGEWAFQPRASRLAGGVR